MYQPRFRHDIGARIEQRVSAKDSDWELINESYLALPGTFNLCLVPMGFDTWADTVVRIIGSDKVEIISFEIRTDFYFTITGDSLDARIIDHVTQVVSRTESEMTFCTPIRKIPPLLRLMRLFR